MSGHCTVVTGAASGMGLAIVRKLLAAKRSVFAVDINATALGNAYGDEAGVVSCCCDLSEDDSVQIVSEKIKSNFDGVEGFVHCAGFVKTAPLGYILTSDAKALFNIHVSFAMQFLGWLGRKSNHTPNTSCVLISSLACHEGDKGNVAYAAAKGGVEGLLKCAAAELVIKGIRVNAIIPGIVDTPLAHYAWMDKFSDEQVQAKRAEYPLGFGMPEDIANVVEFFLSDRSRWITGQTLVCDGGHSIF